MILNVTKDIKLRWIRSSDAEVIYEVVKRNREYLSRWLPFVKNLTLEEESDFISSVITTPIEIRPHVFVIEVEKELAGLIGFSKADYINRKIEIGYWLLPEYQGRGIMTMSVRSVVNWAVNVLSIKRIAICCAVGNVGSNAIPKKLGFKFEGVQRYGELLATGEFTDINVYSFISGCDELTPE